MRVRGRELLDYANTVDDDVRTCRRDDVVNGRKVVRPDAGNDAIAGGEGWVRDRLANGAQRLEAIPEDRPHLVTEHSGRTEDEDLHQDTLTGSPIASKLRGLVAFRRSNADRRRGRVRREVEWVSHAEAHSGAAIRPYLEDARVVVDIGPGIRPQTILSPATHICVEPFEPYVEKLREQVGDDPRFVFLNATWQRVLPLMPDRSVDSVVALDLIEHLRRAEGERLLKHLVRVARQQAVVFTPLGFYPQSYRRGETDRWGMKGGRWQTHRSGWTPDDFGPEWHVVACEDFHVVDENEDPLAEPFGAFWAIYSRIHRE